MIKYDCHTSRGDSGALYLQSALVEVMPNLRGVLVSTPYFKDVEKMVLYCRKLTNRVRSGTKQH